MENEDPESGRSTTLLINGQFVYLGVVLVVNIKILTATSNYSFWSFFFPIASTLSFVLFFWILNLFSFSELNSLFSFAYENIIGYVGLYFLGSALVLLDNGLHLAQYEIREFIESKEND